MPSDFNVIRYTRPKLKSYVYRSVMTYASRTLGFDDSEPAKFRLHCLELYEKVGWTGLSAAFPQLKRSSFFRWRATYLASGKRLSSLVPCSTKPHQLRRSMTPLAVVGELKRLRMEYPRLGKMKLKPLLDEFCEVQGYPLVSSATIGRLITKRHMFYAGKRGKSRQALGARRLQYCPRANDLSPGYVQVDGVRVCDLGVYHYFLTAVDVATKYVWVEPVSSFSSRYAATFIDRIIATSRHAIHTIQTDNGSEFAGAFEAALTAKGLLHLRSRPRSPKTNGYIERFNWTLRDEFLHSHEESLHDRATLKVQLDAWLVFYHTRRVHQSLNYQTPQQYATTKGAVVS